MAAAASPSDKAIKIAVVATVAAVAAYVGFRAYKKQYPFEELMLKGKTEVTTKDRQEQEDEDTSDKVDEIPTGKGTLLYR
jgi:hypothetical protein